MLDGISILNSAAYSNGFQYGNRSIPLDSIDVPYPEGTSAFSAWINGYAAGSVVYYCDVHGIRRCTICGTV